MLNNVTLVGRLVRDPELKYADNGTAVAKLTIACDRYKSEADFIRVVAFKNNAENAANYLSKGRIVGIVGSIKTGKYQKDDGTTVYTTDVYADRIQFIGGKNEGGGSEEKPAAMPTGLPPAAKKEQKPKQEVEGFDSLDEDDFFDSSLPF